MQIFGLAVLGLEEVLPDGFWGPADVYSDLSEG